MDTLTTQLALYSYLIRDEDDLLRDSFILADDGQ